MWTDKNRAKYDRYYLIYPSDLTGDEWGLSSRSSPARRGGKRWDRMRAVMDGVMYILSTGCQWRYIPKDFPPRSTLHDYFTWWILTARWIGSIMHCTSDVARRRNERPALLLASSIAKASKALKKGALYRSAWL